MHGVIVSKLRLYVVHFHNGIYSWYNCKEMRICAETFRVIILISIIAKTGVIMRREDRFLEAARELHLKMKWLNKSKMEDNFGDFTAAEVHTIVYIEENRDVNVTELARAFYMTKGAMSKITKKLIKKGAIESYQSPDNKKEIYYRLTDAGRKVHEIHGQLHSEFVKRDQAVFDQITDEQFEAMMDFIDKFNDHLDVEMERAKSDLGTPGE